MILNLIDGDSNFEVALDLIQNATDLIETKLKTIKITQAFSERLKEYNFKCKKKIEAECLSIIEHYLNSRIQFIEAGGDSDYRSKFIENLKLYFDEKLVIS